MPQEASKMPGNETTKIPGLFNITVEDSNWIITSSFMIFTMQTGLTYWIFGFAMSFGRSPLNNGFIALGDFFIDPSVDDPLKGAVYTAFLFQLSFATTATTIVSGAMAERSGWVWGDHGFLKQLGAVDIAGSGAVHLLGGSAALASALMLGPRLGRYDSGNTSLPMGCPVINNISFLKGNPVNAVMGLFVLWWGWLAFNSGSTYGLSGAKWHYAAKAAVMTMMSSFGGGIASIFFTMAKLRGKIDALDIINGILGSLVSVTAGCFLYKGWEALVVGAVGAILVCGAMPLFDMVEIDDPVGASAVHLVGGIWGVIAVGIFAENPIPLDTTNGRSGVLKGGGWYLLQIQCLTAICLASWGIASTIILLWAINKIITIRMEVHEEILGADLTEHFVKHPQIGVSRAMSALRPVIDTSAMEKLENVGTNPAHNQHVFVIKFLAAKKNYKMSRIVRIVTKNQNLGIRTVRSFFEKFVNYKGAEGGRRQKKTVVKTVKPNLPTTRNVKESETVEAESNTVFGEPLKHTSNIAWIE